MTPQALSNVVCWIMLGAVGVAVLLFLCVAYLAYKTKTEKTCCELCARPTEDDYYARSLTKHVVCGPLCGECYRELVESECWEGTWLYVRRESEASRSLSQGDSDTDETSRLSSTFCCHFF